MTENESRKPMTCDQKLMLRRRGLDPKDYVLIKSTYGALYVRNIHTGVVKILNKRN